LIVLGLTKCPDCHREISDSAEVCIGCGRPMLPKNQQRVDIGSIFSDSPSDQINEQKIADDSKSSFTVLVVCLFIVIALLMASVESSSQKGRSKEHSVAVSPPKTSQNDSSYVAEAVGESGFMSTEEAALKTAIEFTRCHPNSSLGMQITGYKYALEELDRIKTTYPNYKVGVIASLTVEFIAKKTALETELQKLEAELLKEAEASRPQREKEAKEREQKQQQLEAKLRKLEKNFRVKKDEVNKTDFLTHKTFPVYANSRSCVYPYVGRSGYSRWLRIKIQYTASSWLFVEKLIFSIDGENVIKEFDHFEWKRDNNGGSIWEWVDLSSDIELQQLLEKIAKSKKTILRFEGRQYYKDITISSADKKAILETIEYYKAF